MRVGRDQEPLGPEAGPRRGWEPVPEAEPLVRGGRAEGRAGRGAAVSLSPEMGYP